MSSFEGKKINSNLHLLSPMVIKGKKSSGQARLSRDLKKPVISPLTAFPKTAHENPSNSFIMKNRVLFICGTHLFTYFK